MNFIEATSDLKGRDFRRVGDNISEFFWAGNDENRVLMERYEGNTCEPSLSWRDLFETEFEFVKPETIEAGEGDWLKDEECLSQRCEAKMTQDNGERVGLSSLTASCMCIKPIKNLTLIRKGPKVHTFEGVTFDEQGMPWKTVTSGCPLELHGEGSQFGKLKNNNKNYTMTLTEEVSDE